MFLVIGNYKENMIRLFLQNVKYPFEPNPYVPKDSNPIGLYRRNFVVQTDWKDEEIFFALCGVQSAMYVWLNGEKVDTMKMECYPQSLISANICRKVRIS